MSAVSAADSFAVPNPVDVEVVDDDAAADYEPLAENHALGPSDLP